MTKTISKIYSMQELEAKFFSVLDDVERRLWKAYGDRLMFGDDYEKMAERAEVKINNRLRTSAGRYHRYYDEDFGEYHVTIELHPELTKNSLAGTLEHEALHLLTGLSDTKKFHRICDKLGIEKYHSEDFSTIRDYKYKVICTDCESVIEKKKNRSKVVKKPDYYRSGCCSAELKIEEI